MDKKGWVYDIPVYPFLCHPLVSMFKGDLLDPEYFLKPIHLGVTPHFFFILAGFAVTIKNNFTPPLLDFRTGHGKRNTLHVCVPGRIKQFVYGKGIVQT